MKKVMVGNHAVSWGVTLARADGQTLQLGSSAAAKLLVTTEDVG